jgi:antitoxin ParD1/3/4
MPTRNVNLTESLDRFVDDRIASGDYQNASEVVREGLRLLKEREDANHEKLRRLREAVAVAEAAVERGEYRDLRPEQISSFTREVQRRVMARHRARR